MRYGLTARTLAASGVLALLLGAAFYVLLQSVDHARRSARLASHSLTELVAVGDLERLIVDLETGSRGFVITGDRRFLAPWYAALAAFPRQAATLKGLADSPYDVARARALTAAGQAYIRDYSRPLVAAAGRGDPSVRSYSVTAEGKRLVDGLRRRFAAYETRDERIVATRQHTAEANARTATVAAVVGLIGSVLLIVLFAAYLMRAIIRPVRRTAETASRLAGGDLTARVPAPAGGEVGALQRAFNTMASSLEARSNELRRLAEEQSALRRVATLVARGVAPATLFDAVTDEVREVLDADSARLHRYEPDGATTLLSSAGPGDGGRPVGARVGLDAEPLAASVLQTGRPARGDAADGSVAAAPIIAEGRLWGVIILAWAGQARLPDGVEDRMGEFTELVATAIANAESREELRASRARVVTAADDARRRIERDLHDGTQQRLIALGLELRAAEDMAPSEMDELRARLSVTVAGLTDVTEELRELSRGIHPAILSRGGLRAALSALARRSPVPVELDVSTTGRLPDHVEVAAYYVVSEALTNAVKHADASHVSVEVGELDGSVVLSIRDDGMGGADPRRGSGLIGLRDRVEALGGTLELSSPAGAGTTLHVTFPSA